MWFCWKVARETQLSSSREKRILRDRICPADEDETENEANTVLFFVCESAALSKSQHSRKSLLICEVVADSIPQLQRDSNEMGPIRCVKSGANTFLLESQVFMRPRGLVKRLDALDFDALSIDNGHDFELPAERLNVPREGGGEVVVAPLHARELGLCEFHARGELFLSETELLAERSEVHVQDSVLGLLVELLDLGL